MRNVVILGTGAWSYVIYHSLTIGGLDPIAVPTDFCDEFRDELLSGLRDTRGEHDVDSHPSSVSGEDEFDLILSIHDELHSQVSGKLVVWADDILMASSKDPRTLLPQMNYMLCSRRDNALGSVAASYFYGDDRELRETQKLHESSGLGIQYGGV